MANHGMLWSPESNGYPTIDNIAAADVIFTTIGSGQPDIAQGGWAQMFGEGLADDSGTTISVNGVQTLSVAFSSGRVFFRVPPETALGPAEFRVTVGGQSDTFTFPVSAFAPTAAIEGDLYHLDRTPVTEDDPASPGETILATGITGLGVPQPPQLTITAGGQQVEIVSLEDNVEFEFSLPGVYTAELIVPGLEPGCYAGTLTIGGVSWTAPDLFPVGAGGGKGIRCGPPPVTHEVTGVFDAAGFQDLISPGSIVAIGGEFTDQSAEALTVPLSMNLNGFSVTFNGLPGALFGLFDGDDFGQPFDQANVQVPWLLDTSAGTVDVVVNWDNGALSESARAKVSSAPFAANAAPASPGIFAIGLQAIVTNFSLAGDDVIPGSFAQPANSIPGVDNQPAAIGGVITLWCNGLGPVTPLPPTGAAPGTTLFVEKTIRVLVGGVQATVLASVLHPDLVGLNQINAFVPEGVTPGDAVPIVIEVDCGNGQVFRSRADVTIAVRARP